MSIVPEGMTPGVGAVRAWLDWVGGADLPKTIVYHRGHIAFDRGVLIMDEEGYEKWVPAPEVDDVAELMWKAHEDGKVVLVQRRIGPCDWCYIAKRSAEAIQRRQFDHNLRLGEFLEGKRTYV